MVDLTTPSTAPEFEQPTTQSDRARSAPASLPEGREPLTLSTSRALWMLVGIGLMWWAWQLIGASGMTWTVPFLVVSNLVGLLMVIASWLPEGIVASDGRFLRGLEWSAAVMTIAVFVAWGFSATGGMSPYGTDAMAFNQYAAQLAQHGMNPYAHSMAPAFGLFRTPTSFYTYSFTGTPVTALSYPSLSFLVYVPFLALGWSQNLAPLLNVMAWAVTVVMMFAMVPRRLRPVALLLGGFGLYSVFAIGGVTDVLFMPLLLIAAYRWDRFGSSRSTYIAPICFGLAMGMKQNPWPALPFLLVALCLDERARTNLTEGLKRAGRYLAVALAALVVPNIPYFVASPSAWIHGVLTPLFADMVPTGQGTISLSLYLHMGGGSMTVYTAAAGLMLVLLLVTFIGTYPLLRAGAFVLPALAFFFDDRSNVNYFISLIPIGFVAAATVRQAPYQSRERLAGAISTGQRARDKVVRALGAATWFRSVRWAGASAVIALLFVIAAVYSLAAPEPLRIKLVSVMTTGTSSKIEQMTLRVTNVSGRSVTPAFDVMHGGYNSTFWKRVSGPKSVAPRQTATFRMTAPNYGAEPSLYGGFNIVGYVDSPKSFAVSSTYHPNLYHLAFIPDAINQTVPVGQALTVTVQVFNRAGAQLHRAGIRVRLAQIIWGNTGPHKGIARINGRKRAKSSWVYTNRLGIARFTVVGTRSNAYPVTFTAALKNKRFDYIYSDSGNLNVLFGGR
jgi:uncharacterized membrane protein